MRVMEGVYEGTKGRIGCGTGISEEFSANVGLRQVSDIFINRVVEVISRKISKSKRDIIRTLQTTHRW